MPVWVLASLNRLIFTFFWGGKVDLVTRDVAIQPPDFGGFSLVSIQLKVWALHVQWVPRFVRRFSAWMQFLFYYTRVLYGSTPGDLLSYPRCVDFSSCLPFIRRSCLPGSPWMGVSLLLPIRWLWPLLRFVLLSRQSQPSPLNLSFWSSTVVSQLV